METSRRKRKKIPAYWYFVVGISLGTGFGLYLWNLYSQLTTAFSQKEDFIPTRIYSDVTRIVPKSPRPWVEERLKTLAYSYSSKEDRIQFTLHPIDYPSYLIPENHPLAADTTDKTITLFFDKTEVKGVEANGKPISDLYLEPELVATLSRSGSENKKEIRTHLKFEEIPAAVWKAIIAIEDQHFLEHRGLDPRGIARAIWVNLKTFSFAQGGSTITQQLVKNLMARRTKNIFRKVNELFLALLLEAKFEKEEILERYLNEVYLGQVGSLEIHGVAEGAEHFFSKKLEDLNLGEIALMAGLIRGPGYYSPYRYKDRALERQRLVLKKMAETGQISEAEGQIAANLPIRLAPPKTSSNRAPFFIDYVKAELIRSLKGRMTEQEMIQAGFRIYTTLDLTLNSSAQKAVSDGISALEGQLGLGENQRLEGALATVDHTNGFIRALIGGKNYAQSNFNRILNMKRQIGSTFKPIVYLSAFQKGEDAKGIPYGPVYPIEDAPWTLTYDRSKQTWSPKNYEKGYRGWIPLRTALANSVNVAAAKLGVEVGIDNVVKTARSLGVESSLPAVPSLSLGVAELSPIELLRVYATLANRGVQDELTVIRGITQQDGTGFARFVYHPKQVFDPAPVDLLTDILQSVFKEGTAAKARKIGFTRPAAGKTGTTSNYRDAWFAGYTPQLTTVVWVGMDQNTATNEDKSSVILTGAGSALPIWVNFMKKAEPVDLTPAFAESPFLIGVAVDRHSGNMATSDCPPSQVLIDKYIQGHEPKSRACEPNWPPSVPNTNVSKRSLNSSYASFDSLDQLQLTYSRTINFGPGGFSPQSP